MNSARENYIRQRASVFDWSVIMISFLMGFIFPSIRDFVTSSAFSTWMLVVLVMYVIGTALKDLPLSYRMQRAGYSPRQTPALILLLVGHWFIFLFVIIFSESAIRSIFHAPPVTESNMAGAPIILASTIGAGVLTWLVFRPKSKRKNRKIYSADRIFFQELVADFFMICSVSILSFVFWEKSIMGMLSHAASQSLKDIWFVFLFLCILFVLFYMPLRYLYFVEDKEGGRNSKRLLYIGLLLLIRALLELLRF